MSGNSVHAPFQAFIATTVSNGAFHVTTSSILIVLNDAPYGSERSYNGLRLAGSLAKKPGAEVRLFLLGDATGCACAGQKVPPGYYNTELMVKAVTRHGGSVGACGTCMDARGLKDDVLVEGCHRSSLEVLAEWSVSADRVLVF